MDPTWTHRQRPERLERRITFDNYEPTRRFLERLEALSAAETRYPDISFGRTYVNLTVRPLVDDGPVLADDQAFAARIDALVEEPAMEPGTDGASAAPT
jgi:4a-hydroxytetrahydrobiopterin dehydratase